MFIYLTSAFPSLRCNAFKCAPTVFDVLFCCCCYLLQSFSTNQEWAKARRSQRPLRWSELNAISCLSARYTESPVTPPVLHPSTSSAHLSLHLPFRPCSRLTHQTRHAVVTPVSLVGSDPPPLPLTCFFISQDRSECGLILPFCCLCCEFECSELLPLFL